MVFVLAVSVQPDHKREAASVRRSKGARDRHRPLSHPSAWTDHVEVRAQGLPELAEPVEDSVHGVLWLDDAVDSRTHSSQDEAILHKLLSEHAAYWSLGPTPFIYANVVGAARLAKPLPLHLTRGCCASPRYVLYDLDTATQGTLLNAAVSEAGAVTKRLQHVLQRWARLPGMRGQLSMAAKLPKSMAQCLLNGRLTAFACPLTANLNVRWRRDYLGLPQGPLSMAAQEPLGGGPGRDGRRDGRGELVERTAGGSGGLKRIATLLFLWLQGLIAWLGREAQEQRSR